MKLLLTALLTLALGACATIPQPNATRVAIQYATMKMIENSSAVTSGGVLEKTSEIRTMLDQSVEVDTQQIANSILSNVSPADRFLIQSFLVELEFYVLQAGVPADQRVRVNELLNWVDTAARFAS